MNAEQKTPNKMYVTVEQASILCNRSERTIRRWIEQGLVHVVRDQFGSVRIDLDDINRMQATKPDTVHPVRDEITDLKQSDESQEQRIEQLEQQVQTLMQRMDFLLAQINPSNLVVFPKVKQESGDEVAKRGLPSGTQRLVPFADQHHVPVGQIRSLYNQRLVDLTVYQRPGEAVRNKQEWWITPEQHEQLVRYWQEHHIAYEPCPQCEEQMQESEIG